MFGRRRSSDDFAEEIQAHLELEAKQLESEGLSREEARRRARVAFGNVAAAQERFATRHTMVWLNLLGRDLAIALRQIVKNPGFSIPAILLLASGISASTAIFSVVRTVILRPLPFKDPDRLVKVISVSLRTGNRYEETAPLRDAFDWRTMVPGFQEVAVYRYDLVNMRSADHAESLYGVKVTANLLPMLGVRPQLGQWFPAEFDHPGSNHAVILSDDLWRRRFNADPQIVGKTIQMDDEGYQVMGVMPRGFNFPLRLATTALLPTDQMQYWIPLGADLAKEPHGAVGSNVIARLRDGITAEQAEQQLIRACRELAAAYPATNHDLTARLLSLHQQTILPFKGPLLALFAAAGLVLLLTCINLAALLLARGETRAHELAMRMALGGSAWRVACLPIAQGFVLCSLGCLLAVPLSFAAMHVLISLAPLDVPRLADARIDPAAILFAVAVALANGILMGGLNALQVLRRSPREVLLSGSRQSAGRPRTRLRNVLVIVQVALAVVLAAGAGLLLRTFLNLLATDTGYRPDHVYYGVTVLPPSKYSQFQQRDAFFRKVLDRLAVTPGIESASVSTGFPFVGQYDGAKVQNERLAREDRLSGIPADSNSVSPRYLEALGVHLLRGRLLGDADTADTPKVAVIDQDLASSLWPGEDPLGKLINSNDPSQPVWRRVVGIVAPARNKSLDTAPWPSLFLPLAQTSGYVNFIVVKTPASTAEAARLLRQAVAGVDSNQGVFFIQSFPDLIQNTIAVRQFLFRMLAFFAVAALLLSSLGIYGLISFLAASRMREVGIRIALGATRPGIAALIVLQAARQVFAGIVAGTLAFLFLGRLLSSFLFGVRYFDVPTLLLTIAALATATFLAALLPALRSARVQPMLALRAE